MTAYYRPIISDDPVRPDGTVRIAGGWAWASHAERLSRGGPPEIVPIREVPQAVRVRWTAPRAAMSGLEWSAPRIMGILNVTPDSFSDGDRFADSDDAVRAGLRMIADGADVLDIGGESTRPGADTVPEEEEVRRTQSVIAALAGQTGVVLSIDTRKAAVAEAALSAGARLINDVSAFSFDPRMPNVAATSGAAVCLMHAQGDPATMQDDPAYENVLLDVYDALEEAVDAAVFAGLSRDRILVDPGIGFGKTLPHNLDLLRGLSLFHGLACPILLGASRKRFIGTLSGVTIPADRVFGSVAVALAAVSQGVQMIRVHDIEATRQALTLWRAARGQVEQ